MKLHNKRCVPVYSSTTKWNADIYTFFLTLFLKLFVFKIGVKNTIPC